MRKVLLLIAGIMLAASGYSQVSADIGVWGGGLGYMGDIEAKTLTKFNFPAFGAFFRYNFHPRTSARIMFISGSISGEGPFQKSNWQFPESGTKGVQDLSFQAEFNYLRYMIGNKKASFSSYVTAGLGFTYYPYDLNRMYSELEGIPVPQGVDPAGSALTTSLPFGIGFKFNVGKRMGLGVEYQMRKIFDDRLDDLDDPLAHMSGLPGVSYTDSFHNNDWTGFLGVFLTYKVYLGNKACPAYDRKQ